MLGLLGPAAVSQTRHPNMRNQRKSTRLHFTKIRNIFVAKVTTKKLKNKMLTEQKISQHRYGQALMSKKAHNAGRQCNTRKQSPKQVQRDLIYFRGRGQEHQNSKTGLHDLKMVELKAQFQHYQMVWVALSSEEAPERVISTWNRITGNHAVRKPITTAR